MRDPFPQSSYFKDGGVSFRGHTDPTYARWLDTPVRKPVEYLPAWRCEACSKNNWLAEDINCEFCGSPFTENCVTFEVPAHV